MTAKVYYFDKQKLVPEMFENYETGLYETLENVEEIRDIGADIDVICDSPIKHRYSKKLFSIFIEGGTK